MLENAKLHKDELQKLFYEIWYDPKYQFYFGGDSRYSLDMRTDDPNCRQFVSLNSYNEVIGYFSYRINSDVRLAERFGAIHFENEHTMVFAKDLRQVIDDCFRKFGVRTIEFAVVCGNPIEKSYDKIVNSVGGRILCRRSNRALDMQGNLHDDKLYEITREQYFLSCKCPEIIFKCAESESVYRFTDIDEAKKLISNGVFKKFSAVVVSVNGVEFPLDLSQGSSYFNDEGEN